MKTLTDVKAGDLMKTDVVELMADDRVADAVSVIEEYHIGGAPVIDAAGRLVGFFSAYDIARSEHTRSGRVETERGEYEYAEGDEDEEEFFSREDYSPEILGEELVKDWMNPKVISVEPDVSLREVCRVMARESIHRVLVVEGKELRGIVSAFDVVKYLADTL